MRRARNADFPRLSAASASAEGRLLDPMTAQDLIEERPVQIGQFQESGRTFAALRRARSRRQVQGDEVLRTYDADGNAFVVQRLGRPNGFVRQRARGRNDLSRTPSMTRCSSDTG